MYVGQNDWYPFDKFFKQNRKTRLQDKQDSSVLTFPCYHNLDE